MHKIRSGTCLTGNTTKELCNNYSFMLFISLGGDHCCLASVERAIQTYIPSILINKPSIKYSKGNSFSKMLRWKADEIQKIY